jgi:site-specific DNA-methyltransferase (adenine-specific)
MKPIYNKKNIKIYNDDFFDAINKIDNESVDLIFADPPYFLSNGGITCKSGKMELVDKGDWDKAIGLNYIHEFNRRWLSLCKSKLTKDGTIFISGTMHNIYSIGFCLQELDYKIINDIAWFKVNPPPNLSCRFFTHSTETILWAKKSVNAKHCFNYQAMKSIGDPTPGKQMLSLWKITPPKKEEKEFGKHPTQKPIALLNRIILAASKPGDIVFDPFLGSGTTAVASVLNNRKFIGIEENFKFVEIAIKRINKALIQIK